MFNKNLYEILQFAYDKHKGQLRDDGSHYIFHPIAVSMILSNHGIVSHNTIATALLHDVLEDTDATHDDIVILAGQLIADHVLTLTKTKETINKEYYDQIQQYSPTMFVKIADRIHNLHSMKGAWSKDKASRYVGYTKKDFDRWGFNNIYIGKELKQAVEQAEEWIGESE